MRPPKKEILTEGALTEALRSLRIEHGNHRIKTGGYTTLDGQTTLYVECRRCGSYAATKLILHKTNPKDAMRGVSNMVRSFRSLPADCDEVVLVKKVREVMES